MAFVFPGNMQRATIFTPPATVVVTYPQQSWMTNTTNPARVFTGEDIARFAKTGGVRLTESAGSAPTWAFPTAATLGAALGALLPEAPSVPPTNTAFSFKITNIASSVTFSVGTGGTLNFSNAADNETLCIRLIWTGPAAYEAWSTHTEFVGP